MSGLAPPTASGMSSSTGLTIDQLVGLVYHEIVRRMIVGTGSIVVGPDLLGVPAGTEYVWLQTDGSGQLIDILSGVA